MVIENRIDFDWHQLDKNIAQVDVELDNICIHRLD
jgi:hypothetical protein